MKVTSSTDLALSTNHKRELLVKHRPSESTTLAEPLLDITSQTHLSLVGCLSSSQANGTQRDRALPEASVV
uniref:Uncharacterized protein n=1 Tax=Mesocestoides corti TaxID=53468 RepID=A0A5K3FER7_MESCO